MSPRAPRTPNPAQTDKARATEAQVRALWGRLYEVEKDEKERVLVFKRIPPPHDGKWGPVEIWKRCVDGLFERES